MGEVEVVEIPEHFNIHIKQAAKTLEGIADIKLLLSMGQEAELIH